MTALAYALAAGVGWARIYEDKHWLSDVVISAALGTAIGKAVVALNKDRRDARLSVVPLAVPGTWGAAMQYRY